MITDLFRKFLQNRGIFVSRHAGLFKLWPIKLKAAKERGLELRCVVDGGAHEGAWTRELKQVYPHAEVLCVEPRAGAQAKLRELASDLDGIHIVQTLLGPEDAQVQFNESLDRSSVLPNFAGQRFGQTSTVPMTTLDAVVRKLNTPWPDLIKLDLQGFELEALRGATECMQHAQALLLELSLYRFQQGAPLAAEMIGFLGERGFRLYDIVGLWGRNLDGALAQGDFVFLRETHPLFSSNRWFADSDVP
jgi:FkbM family methyltransferase